MGFPAPMRQEVKLVEKFDRDADKRLNAEERKAAREFLKKEREEGRVGGGPGGPGFPGGPGGPRAPFVPPADSAGSGRPALEGRPPNAPGANPVAPPDAGDRGGRPGGFGPRRNQEPGKPGRKVQVEEARVYRAMPFYDPQTLRTLFFEFENADWEAELADFKITDVEVPAKLTIDGKTYKDVGVNFRGASSFFMAGEGRKRSLGVSLDFTHEKQDIDGYQTLDLLNSNDDPSFLRAVLFLQVAREYLPAPKANFVHVVINGESWGLYINKQQFNKDFLKEWYGSKKGHRWKVPGSPAGGGGLEYLGDDLAEYKKRYELKSKDDPKAWESLINLCRVLNETPAEQLEQKLEPILDIDGALRFLAVENALVNNDGYWVRASDYSMYQGEDGCFHIISHDANETFAVPGGPGFGGPGRMGRPGGAPPAENAAAPAPSEAPNPAAAPTPRPGPSVTGVELDPLVAAKDPKKPLLSKLLAVPVLKQRYLIYIREIAEKWLDWERLGPIARQYHTLIADEVRLDSRKLATTASFEKSLEGASEEAAGDRPRQREISLKSFADQRRAYLLNHPDIKALGPTATAQLPDSRPGQTQ